MAQSDENAGMFLRSRAGDSLCGDRGLTCKGATPGIGMLAGVILLAAMAGFAGCGGSSKPISVAASASATTVDGGNSVTLSASVSHDRNAAGVSWSLAGAGVLSHQTTTSAVYEAPAAGNSAVTVTVSAASVADATKTASVSITIPPKPSITTTALIDGNVGSPYTAQLAGTGGISPYTWTLTSGTLPTCITLSSSGALASTGGLMASCAGTTELTFQLKDSGKPNALTATASLTLKVNAAPAITFNGTIPSTAVTGAVYTGSASATGGAGALTYTIIDGVLPTGLTLNASTGAISGNPTSLGYFPFTIQAADAYGDSNTRAIQMLVVAPLALSSANLPATGTTNVAYSGTITASGGTGSYTWLVTGLPNDSLSGTTSGSTLTVSGTPTATATVTFTVKLTDTTTNLDFSQTFTITINSPAPVSLPNPNPASLPAATVNQAYAGAIMAAGGTAPYTWSVNGTPVTAGGISLANGLSASSTGTNTLMITGTPTTTSTVTLQNVKVADSLGSNATQSYSILVNNPGQQLSGKIMLSRYCGNGTVSLPPMTLTLSTTPVMETTTDSNGNYTFANVPDGTYTLTPSTAGPPNGPSSIFSPVNQQVVVNGSSVSGVTFTVTLGFTVSGTVAYHGTTVGQTYVNLIGNCGGGIGTSLNEDALTGGGAFTLHGVPPGTYSLTAWMDPSTLANGALNDADPRGTVQALTVSPDNLSGVAVTMTDPTVALQTAGPELKALSAANSGVVISYGDGSVTDQATGMEAFTSYTVQWSTNSGFTGTPSSATFKATGTNYNVWIVNNAINGISGNLANGTAYYFRVRGSNAAGNSNWVYWGGSGVDCNASGCAVAVTVGEPSGSTYATVTGTVTITSEMAPLITGPLYVGYYDPDTNSAYGYIVANPILGANGYSISVLKSPTTGYIPYAVLDQNKNGLIDATDVSNFVDNPPAVIINSSQTGLIELSYLYDQPRAQTHFLQSTRLIGATPQTSNSYDLKFVVTPGNKLPVAVQLTAGPNVLTPVDIGNLCPGCGGETFAYEVYLGGATPTLGDMYTFKTTFSDGTVRDEYAQVTGFGGSGQLTGSAHVATGLAPMGNVPGQIQPQFTWTYPTVTVPGQIAWSFWLCCSGNSAIWSIPSYESDATGFASSEIPGTLTWGVDPTDSTNTPNPSVLTIGTTYYWQIMAQDDLGNTAAAQTQFIP